MTRSMYDVIIVGSGASGAVMAARLCQAGLKCLMLEAGKFYDQRHFPMNEMETNSRLLWNGGMDLGHDARTVLLRGKVVGGGTVINGGLLERFDEFAFDRWRDASGLSLFNTSSFEPFYREVESHLSLETITRQQWNQNAHLFAAACNKHGVQWSTLKRGQNNCETGAGNDCILCLGGCPRRSKQSMQVTFLPLALQAGLTLESDTEVKAIVHGRSMVSVTAEKNGALFKAYGKKLVLAAGSIGTTELLLRSGYKNAIPELGNGFFCHPQYMSMAFFDDRIDAHKGTLQAVKSSDQRLRTAAYKLENVFAGPVAMSMLLPGWGRPHQKLMRQYRHMASIEVAIRDTQPGKMTMGKNDRLVIQKTLNSADNHAVLTGLEKVKSLLTSLQPKHIYQSPIRIGLHAMGGCKIGVDAASSVVNPDFQVHALSNVYIADSSIFPAAPGINPSLTIMSLACMAANNILQDFGQKYTAEVQHSIIALESV